jgi:aminoglycoside phosphotransferase (APT) family kinase protein
MTEEALEITPQQVRRLLEAQFPQWADQSLVALDSAGVDNAMFRLGSNLVVRLPRKESAAASIKKEQIWLPRLSDAFSLATPRLKGAGAPSDAYPWPWSVNGWIEGAPLRDDTIPEWREVAVSIALFLQELQATSATGGPAPGKHNFWRGAPLASRDRATREAIGRIGNLVDAKAALDAWERDSGQRACQGPPRWIHGDLHAHNLLAHTGRLCAVIDFGGLGVGDPACDFAAAWRLLPAEARPAFRDAAQPDDASWMRGRAWALSISVIELDFYRGAAPALNAIATRTIREVLADHAQG